MRFLSFLMCGLACLSQGQGLARRGTLGIPLRAVPEPLRQTLKLGPQEALEVTSDANGLKTGDLITGVGTRAKHFKSFAEWNELLRAFTDKPEAPLLIKRKSGDTWKEESVSVKVQPKPADESDDYTTIYDYVVSNGHKIRTFITKPKSGSGKFPVLFWIQGINASTIDFPLTTKNYVAPALLSFATDGYVTVRVEKPGVGDSEGGPARLVGWDEEMDIYRQTLKALENYDFVDRDNVYVFGHSMGGCHAPVVCSEFPVKGIITYGTVFMSWLEWAIRSPRVQGILSGQTHAQVDDDVRKTTQFYNYLYNEKKSISWIKKNHPELAKMADDNSPDGVMLGDRSIQYMQEVNDRNFGSYWSKLGKTRVLALFGEFDWIALRDDQVYVADSVNAVNPGFAEFRVLPGADHIFAKCSSQQDSFANFGRQEFNPDLVKVVKDWIKSLN